MKLHSASHLYRHSQNLFFPARQVFMAVPSGSPAPAPSGAPERADVQDFRKELTKLKNDLNVKGSGGSLLKFAEDHGDDMSDWQKNPQNALKFFEDYRATLTAAPAGTGAAKDEELRINHLANIDNLIAVLRDPPASPTLPAGTGDAQKFEVAREIVLSIAESINERKIEISKARDALGNLNENTVNGKVKNVVENIYHTYERMSTPEKIAAVGAIFLFFKMALKDDKGNMLFGPIVKWGAGLLGVNILTQAVTGKSGVDWIAEKTGLERFLPVTADQLPEFMRALALKTSRDRGVSIDMPSELVAMGKLGSRRMSEIMAVYDPTRESIDPVIFGLRPAKEGDPASGEITPKHLFMIIDTMVRKHKTQGVGRSARGDKAAFMLEYCARNRHDFTFVETVSDLFQAESMRLVADSMSPEEWEKYEKVIKNDTKDIWDPMNVMPVPKPEVRRYGVKFFGLTFLTKQNKSPDGNRYTYQIGDDMSVTVGVKDSINSRKQSADLLRTYAEKYVREQITKFAGGTALDASGVAFTFLGDNSWELQGVALNSPGGGTTNLKLVEYGEGGNFKVVRTDNGKETNLDATFATVGKAILD